jgi:hypothetical protein
MIEEAEFLKISNTKIYILDIVLSTFNSLITSLTLSNYLHKI